MRFHPILFTLTAAACFGMAPAHVHRAQAQPGPDVIVDAFEGALGPITTARPSHGKGYCAAGQFVATAEGTRLSVAPVFNGQPVPAIIRFGVGGPNARVADTARTTRGLAIRMETPAGDIWDSASISVPIFGAPTAEVFVANLAVRRLGPNGTPPDAAAVAAFVAANPSVTLQGRWLVANTPPASFATTPYWGVNAFRFQGADNTVRIARWVFEPRAGVERLTAEQLTSMPAEFLADELRRRVATAPVEFDMVLQFPAAGDDVNNPTIAWPDDRPRAVVGRLTVREVAPGPGGACDPISYMTLDQEPGIALSDDPTLAVRAGSYAVSLSRRTR